MVIRIARLYNPAREWGKNKLTITMAIRQAIRLDVLLELHLSLCGSRCTLALLPLVSPRLCLLHHCFNGLHPSKLCRVQ